ncbi:hypothetical protein M758_5G147100 [Ceratodon purpureus]|nr:hypothetical protein M758_5G147100 [Ceratodon purpureus]
MEVHREQWLLHFIVLPFFEITVLLDPTLVSSCRDLLVSRHRYIEYRTLVRGSLGVLRDVAIDWSNWKLWRVCLVFLNSRV